MGAGRPLSHTEEPPVDEPARLSTWAGWGRAGVLTGKGGLPQVPSEWGISIHDLWGQEEEE